MTIIEPGVDQIPSWLIYVDLWCAHKMYEHGRSCLLSGGGHPMSPWGSINLH